MAFFITITILISLTSGQVYNQSSLISRKVRSKNNDNIIIGFLAEYSQMRVSLGALPLAVDYVNNNAQLLPGKQLTFKAIDIGNKFGPYRIQAIEFMTQMRDEKIAAFIGPDESCITEALLASAWNVPMFSFKCSDSILSNKEIFRTFARTLEPVSKVSKSVISLLHQFHWNKFAIVESSRSVWGNEIACAIQDLAKSQNFTITHFKKMSDYIPTKKNFIKMQQIVEDTYRTTRIYVFVGEHIAMVDFLRCMQNRKLLMNGNYIVISVDDEVYNSNRRFNVMERNYLDPYIIKEKSQSLDMRSLRSVIKISKSFPQNPKIRQLLNKIKDHSTKTPFSVPYHEKVFDNISVPIYGFHLYDSIIVYAKAVTDVLNNNGDIYDGRLIMNYVLNRSYHSIQGFDVHIDANGDAEGNYTVITLQTDRNNWSTNSLENMYMQPVGYFINNKKSIIPKFRLYNNRKIQWLNGYPPPAEPTCGFYEEHCRLSYTDWRYLVLSSLFGLFFIVASILLIKHYRYEQKLAGLLWKVDLKDVTFINIDPNTEFCNSKIFPGCRLSILAGNTNKRAYTQIGLYKGNIVAMKKIFKKTVDITRSIRKELKQMREMRHENILSFVGMSIDHNLVIIFTNYCARGSLEDVLANEELHLDHIFLSSIINDILKGLTYLHDSDIVSHGNLHSSNCLIDSRWVCQIADFGLYELRSGEYSINKELKLKRSLWRAPELLRELTFSPRGTQKGDVYSFGIVLYEIVGRRGPWGDTSYTNEEILTFVKNPNVLRLGIFRPSLVHLDVPEFLRQCLRSCWDENPENRPDIRLVRVKLKQLQSGLKSNIFDNMLAMMEKYAHNLEGIVQERTQLLHEEKKKTDILLNQMLPPSVAESLKHSEPVKAECFDCVTIMFSDIVGFTELCAVSTPFEVVEMLNDLYTCCDFIISNYDVYKVETIGDAYMVVSGLPLRNGNRHASEIASLALHILANVSNLKIRHRPTQSLQFRIGVHSGACAAGVVGHKMPRYCLFGDTVNTASRMQSTGEANKIHVSETTYRLLELLGGYQMVEKGLTNIKGKGFMRTYLLVSQTHLDRNNHNFNGHSPDRNSAEINLESLTHTDNGGHIYRNILSPVVQRFQYDQSNCCNCQSKQIYERKSDDNVAVVMPNISQDSSLANKDRKTQFNDLNQLCVCHLKNFKKNPQRTPRSEPSISFRF